MEKHETILCVPLDGHPNYGKATNGMKASDNMLLLSETGEEDSSEVVGVQHQLYETATECLRDSNEITFFEKLSFLQKACIHPDQIYAAAQKYPDTFSKLIEIYDRSFPKEELEHPEVKALMPICSAKIHVVSEMAKFLKHNCPEEKMIIVSSSTVLLDKIRDYFNFLSIKVVVFDGNTSEYARGRNLNAFEKDDTYQFLLLSLKAGGTALTLTRANHLVLMDPDYNPANDRQAIARIYRPSQERTVFIYRLLATGTLEEVKFIRQLEKEDMEQVFQPGGSSNVHSIYDEKELLEYSHDKRSFIRTLLDQMEVVNFNNDEFDVTLADELRDSHQYTAGHQVPDNLRLVKEIWNHVSYAFHTARVSDKAQRLVFDDTDT